jgi:hypothetical protein
MMMAMAAVAAQNTNARSDSWHGVNLGGTTARQAIETLGRPASDKPERLILRRVEELFVGLRGIALRRLEYRGIQGFSHVDLYFKDDRLVLGGTIPFRNMESDRSIKQ